MQCSNHSKSRFSRKVGQIIQNPKFQYAIISKLRSPEYLFHLTALGSVSSLDTHARYGNSGVGYPDFFCCCSHRQASNLFKWSCPPSYSNPYRFRVGLSCLVTSFSQQPHRFRGPCLSPEPWANMSPVKPSRRSCGPGSVPWAHTPFLVKKYRINR